NPGRFTGFENLMAAYGYTLQIYCDFSGYTDIAIGVALLLGFRLPVNFNSPYKSKNITEFWQRWHISLTNWFRDYMFLPIAYFLSDRLKKEKYYGMRTESMIYLICTLVVFLVCGLWHGPRINFVIWGGIHGVALVIHKFYSRHRRQKRKKKPNQFLPWLFTLHFIVLTWVVFRVDGWDNFNLMTGRIFTAFHPELILQVISAYSSVFLVMIAGFAIHWIPQIRKENIKSVFIGMSEPVRFFIILALVILIYQLRSSGIVPFIYFEF
ncbi:MAG: MBOAT family O-acyltransferase, partial [Bacteroidota bacterium]